MGSSTKKHKDKDKERDRSKETKEDKPKRKHRDRASASASKNTEDDDVTILEQPNEPHNNSSGKEKQSRKRRHRDSSPEVVAAVSSTIDKKSSKKEAEDRKSSGHRHRELREDKKRRHSSGDNDDIDVTPTKRNKGGPPPRPKARSPSPPSSGAGAGDSLSIAETNKLRIKLGLKPLDVDSGPPRRPPPPSTKEPAEGDEEIDEETANRLKAERELENETYWKEAKSDFVHAPAKNISKEKEADKLRDKLNALREKRRLEDKLKTTKGLADDSDDDDSASKWVQKSKKLAEEKALAEKRAKALEELDDAFGVGDLVESEFQKAKNRAYTDKNLKGLKVMHSDDRITEGETVIMTLEDKDVLDEKDDVLMNVNMVDDEKYEKNIKDRAMRPELHGYNPFEDAEFDPANQAKKVLSKYDEELEGIKKKTFVIGEDRSEAARKAKIREQMQKANKILESVEAPTLRIASDFLTEEEMTFKKRTKKVRRVRKRLRADDLLMDNVQNSTSQDLGSRKSKAEGEPKVKAEPMDMEIDMEIDDLPTHADHYDVSDIKLEDEGDLDFQLALSKARKLKQREEVKKPTVEKLVRLVQSDHQQSDDMEGNTMVLNSTAEFCRTLGDIPSFSGGDIYADEEMDFETEAKIHRDEMEERGKWAAVEIDEEPIDISSAPTELGKDKAPILEEEPEVGSGIAGALKLAVKKGFLEHEKKKRAPARTMKHLEAQNYSIDDKNYEEDRSHSKREFYSGPTTEFKEKSHYRPEIKLEYTDDDGRPISAKEAFRLLSHKFHGKGSGKNKIDKKRRKADQDKLMQHMSSTDTPLGTLELLQERQKATHSAYVVLTGSNKASQHALSKSSKR